MNSRGTFAQQCGSHIPRNELNEQENHEADNHEDDYHLVDSTKDVPEHSLIPAERCFVPICRSGSVSRILALKKWSQGKP